MKLGANFDIAIALKGQSEVLLRRAKAKLAEQINFPLCFAEHVAGVCLL